MFYFLSFKPQVLAKAFFSSKYYLCLQKNEKNSDKILICTSSPPPTLSIRQFDAQTFLLNEDAKDTVHLLKQ